MFDVRQAILGHLQQGGTPSTSDRVLATRLAVKAIEFITRNINSDEKNYIGVGLKDGQLIEENIENLPGQVNIEYFRPKKQWWENLSEINDTFK